jgi:multicomponent Na+:H+ antiporter subunit A
MAGPTPVSALLHSATMVKAGVFLLARLHPALGGTPLWSGALIVVGTVTMVTGAALAVGQRDLKALLADTTVSALGTLVLLLGIGTAQALAAMVVFLTVHALYKSSLFLTVACVDRQTGSRDLAHLSGLRHAMPITAAAALLAAFGKAGAPPALGDLGKKAALQAKLDVARLDVGALGEWLMLAAVVTNVLMVAASLAVAVRPFWGRPSRPGSPGPPSPSAPPRRTLREAPLPMVLGPAALAAAGILVGLVPAVFEKGLGEAAASAVAGEPVSIGLKIWSGLSIEALLLVATSAVAFALGLAVYHRLESIWHLPSVPRPLRALAPSRLHDRSMALLDALARGHTRLVQQGRLRVYVGATVLVAVALAAPWLPGALAASRGIPAVWPVSLPDLLVVLLVGTGILGATLASRPIVAVMVAGVAGLGLAILFARSGGVDLAITQLLVETLLVVLLAAVLHRFPRTMRRCRSCWREWIPATLGGLLVSGIVLVAAGTHGSKHVSGAMLERALPEAFGRNVVNVILVDFRALDTLGEITVVAAAAVGVWSLLASRRRSS